MSLYGGIKFNIGDGQQLDRPSSGSTAPKQSTESGSHQDGAGDPAKSAFTGSESKAKAPAQPSKLATKPSAALKFAPRIRQPRPAAGPSTTYSAEPVFVDTLRPEPPASASSSSAKDKSHEVVFGNDGKALAKAPAMTLAAGSGKRERGKEEEQRRKLKKKQRRRQQQQQLMSDFKPDEQYDPNRPNDLGEYQYYRKKLREEKRARLLEEKKRREQDGSGAESSYYSDSEDEAPRRDAPKMWAPPTSIYGTVSQSKSQAPPPPTSARPSSPPPASAQGSGDDAYARRVALSQAPTGDDAYARRQAMSSRPSTSEISAPSQPNTVSNSSNIAWTQPATGDEAFARRAALSQGLNQAPPLHPMPTFAPASAPVMRPFPPSQNSAPPPNMPPFPPSAPPASSTETVHLPSIAAPSHDIPGFGSRPAAPAPPTGIAQDTTPGSGPSSDDFARMLEERKKAAASIAERLRNLAPPPNPPAPIPEPDDGTGSFAEKMMRRWGHKEGTGLGADGSGIKHALTAEHVSKPVDPKQPLSKRQIAKQKAAAANAKNRKWVVHGSNRGKIVNANEEERRSEEQGKYGEASRIICLVGLVGGEDDIDEELSEEIGEECSKYGIVERVVQHLVEPAPVDPAECLRVFIVFTGMAGAWRSVKELDGRFFGGRKLRATYFDETRFNAGDRDGPIL